MNDLQTVINEINKRLNTDFGGSEDWELGRRVELYYLLGFCLMTLSKQETQYVYSTSTGKEFKGE